MDSFPSGVYTHGAIGTTFSPSGYFFDNGLDFENCAEVEKLFRMHIKAWFALESLVKFKQATRQWPQAQLMALRHSLESLRILFLGEQQTFFNARNPFTQHSCILFSSDNRFGQQEPCQARTLTLAKPCGLFSPTPFPGRLGISHQAHQWDFSSITRCPYHVSWFGLFM